MKNLFRRVYGYMFFIGLMVVEFVFVVALLLVWMYYTILAMWK